MYKIEIGIINSLTLRIEPLQWGAQFGMAAAQQWAVMYVLSLSRTVDTHYCPPTRVPAGFDPSGFA